MNVRARWCHHCSPLLVYQPSAFSHMQDPAAQFKFSIPYACRIKQMQTLQTNAYMPGQAYCWTPSSVGQENDTHLLAEVIRALLVLRHGSSWNVLLSRTPALVAQNSLHWLRGLKAFTCSRSKKRHLDCRTKTKTQTAQQHA